jgi:hypothetical protein
MEKVIHAKSTAPFSQFSLHIYMISIVLLAADHANDAKMTNKHLYVQLRYAEGVKDMLNRYFKGEDFPVQNYIVKEGKLASQYQ